MTQELESFAMSTNKCLDCRIDRRRIAVPLPYVEQLIEYERRPLPLARPNIAGLGIYEGNIVVSVSVHAVPIRGPRKTKAVLLRELPGTTRWAIEVDETFSFVHVVNHGAPQRGNAAPWFVSANSQDGMAIEWLDIAGLISSFDPVQAA